MIDQQGYRVGVGMIILSQRRQLFWGCRMNQGGWQFPQGGLNPGEALYDGMYRELYEEVGLTPEDVEEVSISRGWTQYKLPEQFVRHHQTPLCIGQKHRWFLLQLLDERAINLKATGKPEFEDFRFVNYWHPVQNVILFKRPVYKQVLEEFAPLLFKRKANFLRRRC